MTHTPRIKARRLIYALLFAAACLALSTLGHAAGTSDRNGSKIGELRS